MYHFDAPQPAATVPFVCPRCAFPMPRWPTLVGAWACVCRNAAFSGSRPPPAFHGQRA